MIAAIDIETTSSKVGSAKITQIAIIRDDGTCYNSHFAIESPENKKEERINGKNQDAKHLEKEIKRINRIPSCNYCMHKVHGLVRDRQKACNPDICLLRGSGDSVCMSICKKMIFHNAP